MFRRRILLKLKFVVIGKWSPDQEWPQNKQNKHADKCSVIAWCHGCANDPVCWISPHHSDSLSLRTGSSLPSPLGCCGQFYGDWVLSEWAVAAKRFTLRRSHGNYSRRRLWGGIVMILHFTPYAINPFVRPVRMNWFIMSNWRIYIEVKLTGHKNCTSMNISADSNYSLKPWLEMDFI